MSPLKYDNGVLSEGAGEPLVYRLCAKFKQADSGSPSKRPLGPLRSAAVGSAPYLPS